MKSKLVVSLGALTVGVVVAFGCSSSDSGNAGVAQNDASTPDGTTTNDAGSQEPKDAANTQDAKFDANSINAPEVTIDYLASCPAFTKCESNPAGVWKTTGGCVSSELFASAKEACAGFQESDVVIKAKGILTITDTTVQREAQVKIAAKLKVPKSCAPAGLADCGLIAIGLKTADYGAFETATCTDDGENCQCDVTKTLTDGSGGTYTKAGGTITTEANEKYDYCVNAGTLTYRKQDSAGTPEPSTFTAAP